MVRLDLSEGKIFREEEIIISSINRNASASPIKNIGGVGLNAHHTHPAATRLLIE